jgi:hypothetical protein
LDVVLDVSAPKKPSRTPQSDLAVELGKADAADELEIAVVVCADFDAEDLKLSGGKFAYTRGDAYDDDEEDDDAAEDDVSIASTTDSTFR